MAAYQPTIYDIANLGMIQSGITPLIQEAQRQKEFERRRQDLFALQTQRDDADYRRAEMTQDKYLDRLGKMEDARDKNALAKHYRQYGITKGANEGDDEFEVRAQKELKARAESELGALRGHIDTITAKRNSLAAQAESKLTGEIETAARSAAAAMLKPEEAAILLSKGPGAFANRPEVLDLYNKAKAELLKNAQVPLGIQAELGQLTDELRSSRALYDDAIKGYRNMGGGLSSLFPKVEAAPAATPPQSGLTLPPPPGGGASLLGPESPAAPEKKQFPGILGAAKAAIGGYADYLGAVTAPTRKFLGPNAKTLLMGGDFVAPTEIYTPEEKATANALIGKALEILNKNKPATGQMPYLEQPYGFPAEPFIGPPMAPRIAPSPLVPVPAQVGAAGLPMGLSDFYKAPGFRY